MSFTCSVCPTAFETAENFIHHSYHVHNMGKTVLRSVVKHAADTTTIECKPSSPIDCKPSTSTAVAPRKKEKVLFACRRQFHTAVSRDLHEAQNDRDEATVMLPPEEVEIEGSKQCMFCALKLNCFAALQHHIARSHHLK